MSSTTRHSLKSEPVRWTGSPRCSNCRQLAFTRKSKKAKERRKILRAFQLF